MFWHLLVKKVFSSLQQIIDSRQRSSKHWELTLEGKEVAANGSHEARVYNAVPAEGGILQAQLMVGSQSM